MEMIESEIHQVFVKLLDGKHSVLNFGSPSISVPFLKRRIQTLTSIPPHLQLLRFDNSRVLHDHQSLTLSESRETTEISASVEFNSDCGLPLTGLPKTQLFCSGSAGDKPRWDRTVGKFPVVVHLLLRLRGGKGGFGSLLRGAATKAGQKKTNNFDACRDMSGRRLRHVNAEKKLEEWRAEADERKLEKIAEEYIKKKAKEVSKSATRKGADNAEKYVAKYREDSAKCMEEVDRSVRESMNGLKRKNGKVEMETNAKRLKIWLGKRKMGDSDSEDMDDEDMDGDKEENAKSGVTDDRNPSDPSKEAEGTSDSITCEELVSPSLEEESPVSQEEHAVTKESLELDNRINGYADDGKSIIVDKPAHEIDHNGANMKVLHESHSSELKEVVSEVPGVYVPEEIVKSAVEVSSSTNSEQLEEVAVSLSAKVQDLDRPLDFDDYNVAEDLEVLGMERIKVELQSRGLKCGGTLHERAARLFLLKTVPLEILPKKLFAKK